MPPAADAADRPSRGPGVRPWHLVAALLAGSLCLRPPIVEVATLLPGIRAGFGLSFAGGGLLTTIPVVCMGLFALPAGRLYAALGPRAGLTLALCLAVVAGALRAATSAVEVLFALTVVTGIGAGLAGALLPAIVRQAMADAPARATGIYSLGINGGAGLAAALAVPLATLAGGWRGAFLAFGAAGLLSVAAWLALSRGALAGRSPAARGPAAWRQPFAWYLGLLFGLQALCFFGLNAWLASAYAEWGWSPLAASWLVAALNFVTLPSSLLVGLAGDRIGRAAALTAAAALLLAGLVGAALLPAAGWLWAVVAGLACGATFPLILTMSVDVAATPREAGAVAGVTLAVGYVIASLAPVLLGVVRDAAGDFASAFLFLAGAALLLLAASANLLRGPAIGPARLRNLPS